LRRKRKREKEKEKGKRKKKQIYFRTKIYSTRENRGRECDTVGQVVIGKLQSCEHAGVTSPKISGGTSGREGGEEEAEPKLFTLLAHPIYAHGARAYVRAMSFCSRGPGRVHVWLAVARSYRRSRAMCPESDERTSPRPSRHIDVSEYIASTDGARYSHDTRYEYNKNLLLSRADERRKIKSRSERANRTVAPEDLSADPTEATDDDDDKNVALENERRRERGAGREGGDRDGEIRHT